MSQYAILFSAPGRKHDDQVGFVAAHYSWISFAEMDKGRCSGSTDPISLVRNIRKAGEVSTHM